MTPIGVTTPGAADWETGICFLSLGRLVTATLAMRVDHIWDRVDIIEKRLELVGWSDRFFHFENP